MLIRKKYIVFLVFMGIVGFLSRCKVDPLIPIDDVVIPNNNYDYGIYDTTPYVISLPNNFPEPDIPSDNPMTIKGVELGRMLFYDPILSSGDVMSCNTCHKQENAFTINTTTSSSMSNNTQVERNIMPLFNLAWETDFSWDGRKTSLEDKILGTMHNPFSFNISWGDILGKLNTHADYPKKFHETFGEKKIKQNMVIKALAQFLRSIVSGNSKWDQFLLGQYSPTQSELMGFDLFSTEQGDCFHCHPHSNPFFTDHIFRNNGLDTSSTLYGYPDLGYGYTTSYEYDNGKFRSVSLRNIEFTAPYMHDGRFSSLEEVIEHYNSGGHYSPTVDANMKYTDDGLYLSETQKTALLDFLKMLSDNSFIEDDKYSDPFD